MNIQKKLITMAEVDDYAPDKRGNGTDRLYRDPENGRLWELTSVAPQMKDGGPPRLAVIDPGAAERKYGKIDGV
jgi:hypothetical protein